jgi:hypothetical protein
MLIPQTGSIASLEDVFTSIIGLFLLSLSSRRLPRLDARRDSCFDASRVKTLVSGLLIAVCAAAFLVPCLGACLATAQMPAAHGCCTDGKTTIRAVQVDCCAVTAGVRVHSSSVAVPRVPITAIAIPVLQQTAHPAVAEGDAFTAPSPPLILRV